MKRKRHYNRNLNRAKLFLSMSSIVFFIVSASSFCFFSVYALINWLPFLDIEKLPRHSGSYILAFISLGFGFILSILFRKFLLVPLHNAYLALGKVSDGDFKINVRENGIGPVRKVAKSLNHMARELENVETMRNDFINNFSHEFKTPIVSISGFAKMLKNPELTEEEKEEYLDIIISESERLSQLSSNVLNLTKLDNQSIVTDLREFNVTEQIRRVVILLERKWTEKNIEIDFECPEYTICANEELMSQVWINLLDNAIKFSPKNSVVRIDIKDSKNKLVFTFADNGKGMSEKTARHAFDKFFQGDVNHKGKGYGIGLAISKRICELHNGSIRISKTDENGTVFEVTVPS